MGFRCEFCVLPGPRRGKCTCTLGREETLMATMRLLSPVILSWLVLFGFPTWSWAHGFAGQRFFPTTLAVDDPFVSDELSFLFQHVKEPRQGEEPPTGSTEIA